MCCTTVSIVDDRVGGATGTGDDVKTIESDGCCCSSFDDEPGRSSVPCDGSLLRPGRSRSRLDCRACVDEAVASLRLPTRDVTILAYRQSCAESIVELLVVGEENEVVHDLDPVIDEVVIYSRDVMTSAMSQTTLPSVFRRMVIASRHWCTSIAI